MSSASARFKRSVIQSAVPLVRAVMRRPQLKYLARRILASFPSLRERLQGMMYRAALAPNGKRAAGPQADSDLSPRTLRMYRELQRAFEKRGQ
jgi:hypothetical protein